MCEQSNDCLNNEWEKRVMNNTCFLWKTPAVYIWHNIFCHLKKKKKEYFTFSDIFLCWFYFFFWSNLARLFLLMLAHPHPSVRPPSWSLCSWGSSGPLGKSLDVLGKCLFLVDLTWNFNLGKPAATCCHSDSFELLFLHWVMNSSIYFYLLLDSRQQQSREKSVIIARQLHLCPDYCQYLSSLPLSGEGGSQKGQNHLPS